MDRRAFLMTGMGAATATTAACLARQVTAAEAAEKASGTGLRTKIAVAPQWFKGSHVEQIEQIAAAGFAAFETLGCGGWEDKEAVRRRCEELGVACGAVGGGMGTIGEWGPNDPENHPRFVQAVKVAHRAGQGDRIETRPVAVRSGACRREQGRADGRAGQGRQAGRPAAGRRPGS